MSVYVFTFYPIEKLLSLIFNNLFFPLKRIRHTVKFTPGYRILIFWFSSSAGYLYLLFSDKGNVSHSRKLFSEIGKESITSYFQLFPIASFSFQNDTKGVPIRFRVFLSLLYLYFALFHVLQESSKYPYLARDSYCLFL